MENLAIIFMLFVISVIVAGILNTKTNNKSISTGDQTLHQKEIQSEPAPSTKDNNMHSSNNHFPTTYAGATSDKYATGRSISRIISGIGWVLFAISAIIIMYLIGNISGYINEFTVLLVVIFVFLLGIGGLMLVFTGQMARAIFDTASAAQITSTLLVDLSQTMTTSLAVLTQATATQQIAPHAATRQDRLAE